MLCTRLAQARTRRIGLIDSFMGLRTKSYESCREGSLYLAADVIVQYNQGKNNGVNSKGMLEGAQRRENLYC